MERGVTKIIEIISRRDGFRRAGIEHHGVARHVADAFTAAQLDQLRREHMLTVREIEEADQDAAKTRGK